MSERLLRDRATLRLYAALGVVGYAIGALGPTLALVRDRLELGDVVYGVHPSVLAAGLILAGLLGERPLARLGTDALLRGSLGLLAAACAALATASAAGVSLAAAGLFGIGQGLALAAIATELQTRHGALASVALSEANVVASATGVVAPAALAGLVAAGLDGRAAMLAIVPLAAPLVLSAARGAAPAVAMRPAPGPPPRRGSFARWWLALFLFQCVEICLLYWTAPYLEHRTGLSAGAAGGALTAFFVAQVTGRALGMGAVRRFAAASILAASLGLASAGILVLWVATAPALAVAGLALASLGVANLYPVSAAMALGAGATAAQAGVRVSLAIGAAGLTAPPLVGGLAALAGLGVAFAALPVLAAAGALALAAAAR